MKALRNEAMLSCMLGALLLCLADSGCAISRSRKTEVDSCTCVEDSVSVDLFFTSMPQKDCDEECDEQNKRLRKIVFEFKTAFSAEQRIAALAKLDKYLYSIREGRKSLKIDILMNLLGVAINAKGSGCCCFVIRDANFKPSSLVIIWNSDRNIVDSIFRQGYFA